MPKVFDLGNPRIMTSTEALEVEDIPENLLVVGGGYIGMELGTVYAALGSKIVLVEALDSILAGADPDLARPVVANAKKMFKEIRLKAKVTKMATAGKQIKVEMEYNGQKMSELYDRVLVAVGRVPNSADLGLENTKVELDEKGFVKVNQHQQTGDPDIYAIGDIAGGILLAHKAHKEARIAVENINGEDVVFENIVIPAVVFTDPELAWCGLTEAEAKERGVKYEVAKFPWSASGRAMSFDRTDGLTKMLIDPGKRAGARRGHRGRGRGRIDFRSRAGVGNGRDRRGHRADGASASDAVRNADGMRRGVLRPRHAHDCEEKSGGNRVSRGSSVEISRGNVADCGLKPVTSRRDGG